MPQTPLTILLRGGTNIVTPAIAVPPGQAIAAVNYEADVRGYTRVGGYERYNGESRPSQMPYYILYFDAGTAAITAGQTVTGLSSADTAVALADAIVTSGSYGTADAAGYLVLAQAIGADDLFTDNEALQVGGITKMTADGEALTNAATTQELDKAYTTLAVEAQRALIEAVPGSGPVRGINVLNGVLYAIRDNAGATAGALHKATTAGWVAQSLGSYLRFDAGTNEFTPPDDVTGGTSGATATVRYVVLLSGDWGGSATGFLVLESVVGTFQNNEIITGSPTGSATVDGTIVANALSAGGRYDFTNHNFYGPGFTERMYACNGVDRAFEWDGTYFTPIFTGLSDTLDKPTHIAQFSNHLILGFTGGYYVNSEIGTPTAFQTTLGAGDGALGCDFTNILESSSTALIMIGSSKIAFLTGKDIDTFSLDFITEEAGGEAWTAQQVGNPIYLDDAGVRRLTTAQAFGDWRMGTVTQAIEPVFKLKQDGGVSAVASIRARSRDQYRLFYDDLTAVSVYFGRENPECMMLEYAHQFSCASTGTLTGETRESIFTGGENGYVYELDRGTSFDGETITAFLRLAWNSAGSPGYNKRWESLRLECDVAPSAELSLSCDFEYGNPDFAPSAESLSLSAGGGFWNEINWNEFYWSAQAVGIAWASIDGMGNTMSPVIGSTEVDDELPHTLSSMTINYSMRAVKRGA